MTVAGTQSSFGRQVRSTRPTTLDYTMKTRTTYREPKGIQPFTHVDETVYLGEAHQRHKVPDTPGPGKYSHRVGLGKQVIGCA